MINAIPIVGWLISFVLSASLSIPFYFIWNDVGPRYFYWLPTVYQHVPFWDCVELFMLMPMLKLLLVPKLVEITQKVGKD